MYWTLTIIFLAGYYGLLVRKYYGFKINQTDSPPLPPPIIPEEWMDDVLNSLEGIILHAQKKKYHPEEMIEALQNKIQEQKKWLTDKKQM